MLNKMQIIGNVATEIESRTMQNGGKVANFNIATSEKWKTQDGEQKERTEFHRVVVFAEPLIKLIESYVNKGDKLYLCGQLETRKWTDQQGNDKYTTEVVLRPYKGEIKLLGSKQRPEQTAYEGFAPDDMDDSDIPF
jgi:single-strand DNA-binding protein